MSVLTSRVVRAFILALLSCSLGMFSNPRNYCIRIKSNWAGELLWDFPFVNRYCGFRNSVVEFMRKWQLVHIAYFEFFGYNIQSSLMDGLMFWSWFDLPLTWSPQRYSDDSVCRTSPRPIFPIIICHPKEPVISSAGKTDLGQAWDVWACGLVPSFMPIRALIWYFREQMVQMSICHSIRLAVHSLTIGCLSLESTTDC